MRDSSYLQNRKASILDKFGMFLSKARLNLLVRKKFSGILLDVGCGFEAQLTRNIWNKFSQVYLADLKLSSEFQQKYADTLICIEGELPSSLRAIPNNSIDFIFANNIIEHLDKPLELLVEIKRVAKDDAHVFINVPSWLGKYFLEMAAFKFGLAPREEMEDHKTYYDRKSLWTLVRSSGFLPSHIKHRESYQRIRLKAVQR